MQNALDLVEYAVDFAQRNGASYAEARFTDLHNENFTTRNGSILDITDSFIKGIGIRVIFQGAVAFSSTDKLTKENIEKSVLQSIKLARNAHRKDPIGFSEEKFEEITWKTPVKIPFSEISREEKMKFLNTLAKRQKKEFGKKLSNKVFMLDLVDETEVLLLIMKELKLIQLKISSLCMEFAMLWLKNTPNKEALELE